VELEAHQNRVRDAYERQLAEHEASIANWDKKDGPAPEGPPRPPRFVVADTSTEKMGELLARSDRGILVKRDELTGWLGSMEKYAGRGSGADRAFWLQSFDGGPFRGQLRIRAKSAHKLDDCGIGACGRSLS
jgi:hypothetical protein